jgi:hypothetical protein
MEKGILGFKSMISALVEKSAFGNPTSKKYFLVAFPEADISCRI